jgi:hypothetical protein
MTKPNDLPTSTVVTGATTVIANIAGALYNVAISDIIEDAYGTIATQDADAVLITGGSITGITDITVADGGTGASTAADARTNLGLVIGTDVQGWSAVLDATTASFTTADETKLDGIEDLADVTDTANVTAAGALMDSEVTSLSGIKTLNVPDSTTISAFGATLVDDATAGDARSTLGLVIGTDVQAWDAQLDTLSSYTVIDDDTLATASDTSLATSECIKAYVDNNISTVVDDDNYGDITVSGTGTVWSINADTVTYDKMQDTSGTNVLLGRETAGAGTIEEISCTAAGRALLDDADASAQRTTLGLGSLAEQSTVNNADWSGTDLEVANGGTGVSTLTGIVKGNGISAFSAAVEGTDYYAPSGTDVAVTDGGTGASDASGARTNLGLVIGTDVQAFDATLTALAGLSTGANKIPYSTGTDTFSQLDFVDEDDMSSNSATAIPSQQSVKTYVDGAVPTSDGIAKAWVNFGGKGTVAINDDFNVSSITDSGAGEWVVNLGVTMANANYAVALAGTQPERGTSNDALALLDPADGGVYTTTAFTLLSQTGNGANYDMERVCATVFGDLA